MKKYRIKKIIKKTENYFEAYYKNHHICIEKEQATDSFENTIYYIQVSVVDGGYVYDGWWDSDKLEPTMEDAIEEALKGSCLI